MTPNSSHSNVIEAAGRFADRHFPCGSRVSHPIYGSGTIQMRDGQMREVAFSKIVHKKLDELPRSEWPDCNPLNVKAVSWIEHECQWVEVTELKMLRLQRPRKQMADMPLRDLGSILNMMDPADSEMPEMPDIHGL